MAKKIPMEVQIRRLKKKLDGMWSKAVRKRDGKCVTCSKKENLQAHHWLVRKARSLYLRWHLLNGVTLCYYCHLCEVHRYSDKQFMDKFFAILDKRVSPAEQAILINKAVNYPKYDLSKLQDIEVYLSNQL